MSIELPHAECIWFNPQSDENYKIMNQQLFSCYIKATYTTLNCRKLVINEDFVVTKIVIRTLNG